MHIQFDETYAKGGVTFSQFIKDDYFQQQFKDWMEDGNVSKRADGTYSTQDAQYRNSLKGIGELKKYFYNEFIKGQYDSYAGGGMIDLFVNDMVNNQIARRTLTIKDNEKFNQFMTDIQPYIDKKIVRVKENPINKQEVWVSLQELDSYAEGGSTDDKVLIGKAIEYITGSAIERDSIQFEANKIAFRYKGQKTFTDISQKLIENTISMHRKSLEGRYADGGEAGKFEKGGKAGNDIYDFDKKMALINLGQVYEYAIKIDKMIKENTDLEEWVKMKLTRIEQNISDVKHSLEGWEKYKSGGEIAKKQLLHIAKYSKDLIKMIEGGSKLMSWQEGKLAVSSDSIDNIYHHLDYQMGNRAEDLDVDGKYKDGGEVQYETKRIVNEAKNQKKNTHFAIHKPTNSIVFTWDFSGYDTKEMNENKEHYFYYDVKDIVSGNVDKYVKSDYAIVQRKDLEKRGIDLNNYLVFLGQKYDRSESNNESDSSEAGFNDEGTSMVLYHEKNGNFLIPKGQVYLYLYDVEDSRGKLQSEEYDWVFYPYASQNMAWASDFIPPLKKIWTKKFQKDHKGSEHLLGVIKAYLIEESGKKELYIDMMSVKPKLEKQGIMSYMIKKLRDTFKLEQDQVTFSKLTPEGEKFVAKKTYADGGETSGLITDEQVRDLSFKIKIENVPLKKGVLLHEIVTLEEFDLGNEKNINFYPFHLIYGDSSLAIFDAFGVDEVAGLKRADAEKKINELKAQGKTEKDDSFMAGLTNYVGDKLFMFFNVARLSYEGFANRVLPHEALHLSRNLISLLKNDWVRENLNTPKWWEDKRAVFVDMGDSNEEFFAETLERTTAIAMDGWYRVTGQKCVVDKNKTYADGGDISVLSQQDSSKIKIGTHIYYWDNELIVHDISAWSNGDIESITAKRKSDNKIFKLNKYEAKGISLVPLKKEKEKKQKIDKIDTNNIIIYYKSGNGESWIYRIANLKGKDLYSSNIHYSEQDGIIKIVDDLSVKYSSYIYENDHSDKIFYGALVIINGKLNTFNTNSDKWFHKKIELGIEKYADGGGVEKSIRGFKVGDLFYRTPSTSGNKRYYKITSIDNYYVKVDDYDYVLNGTDVNTGRKSSFTTGSFGFMVDEHEISRYEKGDLGYAKGGDIPHEDKMYQLPLEMVVYVPSTQDVDKVISVDEMVKRVNEVKEYLGSKFGGYSSTDKLGGFVDSRGNLINEDVTQVTSFATKEAFKENKEELVKQLAKWGKKWGQEAIGFEFEGDLLYVPQELKTDTKVDEYRRGGFMYEVQKKGSPSNDMRETMFTAKNLTDLKKKIIEKHGTSEGFLVSRRTQQGYYVPVKFENGGEIKRDYLEIKSYLKNKDHILWHLTNENIHNWYSEYTDMDKIKNSIIDNNEYRKSLILYKDYLKDLILQEKEEGMPLKKRLLRMKGFNLQIKNIEKILNETK